MHSTNFVVKIIVVLACASISWPALHARQDRGQRPAERGADLLSLEFVVVTPEGMPVMDLKPDDVSIRIGGRQRPVRSLQFIEMIGGETSAHQDMPLPYATNSIGASGRNLLLVLDEDSFRPGQAAALRDAAAPFLSALGPQDRVSLVTVPYGGTRVPFTTDHSRIRLTIPQVVGHAPATETGSELACRTRRTLETLTTHLETLAARGEPMTLVFVTAALAAPRRDAAFGRAPGMCELSEQLFTQVAQASGAAHALFYVVRWGDAADGGLSMQRETVAGSDNPLAGIEHLAGATGAKLFALTGSGASGLERVARETAGHYLATFDAQPNDRSGRVQSLDIRVARRGVEVRSRPHVAFAKPDPAAARLLQPSLRDMLSTPVMFRDLPLRAAGFSALTIEGDKVRIVAMAEPTESTVTIETLGAILVDRDNKVAAQWMATAEELRRRPVTGAMAVPPGAYRLRVAAIDTTGRAGTVDAEVEADVVRTGPLKLSSLVLGLNRADGFLPKLHFTIEPLAIAYIELEGAPAGARVAAAVEVAQSLNGPAIVTVPLAIENSGENRYTATGSIAIGALPPGDYVVRAMVGIEGSPMTRVVRTIRKSKN